MRLLVAEYAQAVAIGAGAALGLLALVVALRTAAGRRWLVAAGLQVGDLLMALVAEQLEGLHDSPAAGRGFSFYAFRVRKARGTLREVRAGLRRQADGREALQ